MNHTSKKTCPKIKTAKFKNCSWNLKHLFINGCFNWMIPSLDIEMIVSPNIHSKRGSRSLYPLCMAIVLGLMFIDLTTWCWANLIYLTTEVLPAPTSRDNSWVQVLCDKCQWPGASPEKQNWGPKSQKTGLHSLKNEQRSPEKGPS